MDDLNSVISSILGDPQKMEQLRSVAQNLGIAPGAMPTATPEAPAATSAPAQGINPDMINMLGNLMSGMNQGGGAAPTSQPAAPPSGDSTAGAGLNLGALSALAGIFGGMNGSGVGDKNVQLLRAIQPHISSSRSGRVDDAVRIMQLVSAWPAIRDSGLLGSLGNMTGLGGLGNLFSGGGHR